MKIRGIATITLMLWLALTGTAQAIVLITPPLAPSIGTANTLQCRILNVSGVVQDIVLQVLSDDGIVLDELTGSISPNVVFTRSVGADFQPRYCRFTGTGVKGNYRTSVCVFEAGVGTTACLPGQ